MRNTSYHSEAAQPLRGVGRFANPVAHGLGLFLLLVISLLLPPVVCANTQADTTDIAPTGILERVDTAPVVVNGKVQFHVVGVSAYPGQSSS